MNDVHGPPQTRQPTIPGRMHDKTLDPSDWNSMIDLARRIAGESMEYLRDVRERPAWRPTPAESRAFLEQPLPMDPTPPEVIYEEFKQLLTENGIEFDEKYLL